MDRRNYFWDFWKFIAAIGVILVHAPLPGNLGKCLEAVGTWGVSFFFLISGYACFGPSRETSGKILKRLRRNGIITAIAVAVYFLFTYLVYRGDPGQMLLWKISLRKPVTYVRMILLGDFEFIYGTALWFMVALLYGYLVFYVLVRFGLKKVIYVLLPLFLILRIAVDMRISYTNCDWHWSGNALVGALPMMLLGYVIADNKDKLLKIPTWVLISGSLISAGALFVTSCVKVGGQDISTPFKILCASLVFILGIKKPGWYIVKPISFFGERGLSLYLSHPFHVCSTADKLHVRTLHDCQRTVLAAADPDHHHICNNRKDPVGDRKAHKEGCRAHVMTWYNDRGISFR